MKGHQYANIQQRVNATGNTLDKEFNYLQELIGEIRLKIAIRLKYLV